MGCLIMINIGDDESVGNVDVNCSQKEEADADGETSQRGIQSKLELLSGTS